MNINEQLAEYIYQHIIQFLSICSAWQKNQYKVTGIKRVYEDECLLYHISNKKNENNNI